MKKQLLEVCFVLVVLKVVVIAQGNTGPILLVLLSVAQTKG